MSLSKTSHRTPLLSPNTTTTQCASAQAQPSPQDEAQFARHKLVQQAETQILQNFPCSTQGSQSALISQQRQCRVLLGQQRVHQDSAVIRKGLRLRWFL
jgi:uncharacterized cupin superfamily protein